MAIRIHVAGIRGGDQKAVRNAFPDLDPSDIHESGGWIWFTASVWKVSAQHLADSLGDISGTQLLIHSEDGSRWYLRLSNPDHSPFRTMHEFDWPAFDSTSEQENSDSDDMESELYGELVAPPPNPDLDDPLDIDDDFFNPDADKMEAASRGPELVSEQIIEYYTEMGVPLSAEVQQELREQPDAEVRTYFRARHISDILEALTRFNIPHDTETVRSVLSGDLLTRVEAESDLGDLPRFLCALGFGEYWEKWVREAEEATRDLPEEDDDDDLDTTDADDFDFDYDEPEPPPPDTGELVFEGKRGTFLVADTEALATDDEYGMTWAELPSVESELTVLGFTLVGTVVSAALEGAAFRAYVHPHDNAYAVWQAHAFGMHGIDFYTAFVCGASLTTSQLADDDSLLRRRILFRSTTSSTLADQLREHLTGVERLETHGLERRGPGANLRAFAAELDRFLERRLG